MESVAAGDEVAVDPVVLTVLVEGDKGRVRLHVVQGDVLDAMDMRGADGILRGIEITRHLGLPIDHHLMPAAFGKINAEHLLVMGQVAAVMGITLCLHPRAGNGLAQQLGRAMQPHRDPAEEDAQHRGFREDSVDDH